VSPAPGGPGKPRFQATSGDWIWGVHAVEAALSNPSRPAPRRLLATPDRARELERRFGALKRLEVTDAAGLARLLPAGAAHQGLALEGPEPEPVDLEDFAPEPGAVLLMLDQVTDAGNVGAILRTAAAFGVPQVWALGGTAGLWSPKVLRAGMGAHFALRIVEGVDLAGLASRYHGRLVATTLRADTSIFDVDLGGDVALLFGNEGAGLSPELADKPGIKACIPMPGSAESLNVAAAAAVCLFERVRQTRGQ